MHTRGVTGGWAGWAIAHPGFDRIESRWEAAAHRIMYVLLAHLVLESYIDSCQGRNWWVGKVGRVGNYLSMF